MSIQDQTPPRWQWGAASHQGGRHEQQDRWGIFISPNRSGLLAIIADGMGGHLEGALGAQTAIDVARVFVETQYAQLSANPAVALNQLCKQIHNTINQRSETARSTIVILWLHGNQGYWLNIGDSRLYHFRQAERLMRTRDHSAVQLLMDLGEIEESQMATHPAQNRLYRSLGGEEPPKPDSGSVQMKPDDLFVLCTDGVWEHIAENEFWTAATLYEPQIATKMLTEQAVCRGGAMADNATLLFIRMSENHNNQSWLYRVFGWLAAPFTANRQD
ncbi:MAG: protein phosphatase 2C domain-containing protein [Candidatus Competibacteraceae bacterium]